MVVSLPFPLDPLVGRTEELAALEVALAEARLVTITGLGGTGKTRLAREVARRAAAGGDSARFVDLAPVADPNGVATAIAAVLEVRDSADIDIATAVADELARSASLLVLDNLEHLLPARAFIGSLVERAAPLRILITSRMRLGLPGEREFPLKPLGIPATARDLDASDASLLFLRRARERGRVRAVDEHDAVAIVEICRRLDGLPLALELAAAWTRILTPRAIARRLEEGRLELAGADGARDASLEAVVQATLGLLDETDAEAFDTLAVFAGGFDEPAAAAVIGIADVLPVLRRLEDVALVTVLGELGGEPRFGLLETIRAVAAARLGVRDDEISVRQRHMEYFARGADERFEVLPEFGAADAFSMRDFVSRDAAAWFAVEEGNLRVAFRWAVDHDDGPSSVRLAASMAARALRSGALREGAARVRTSLEMTGVPPAACAQALVSLAWLQYSLWDHPSLRSITTEALGFARTAGRPDVILRALTVSHLPQPNDVSVLREAAEIAQRIGSGWVAAACRMNLGDLLSREGRTAEALGLHAEAYRAFSENGDAAAASFALSNLGETYASLGRLDEALECQLRAVAGLRASTAGVFVAWALDVLAVIEALRGQQAGAYDHLREAADLAAASESAEAIVEFFDAATTVLAAQHPTSAARSLGAVDRAVERSGERRPGGRVLEATATRIERALGPVRFGLERRAGREADPRVQFEEVRAVLSKPPSAAVAPVRRRLTGAFGSFTRREEEVLALLAQGRSDGEIAAELYISPKTASVHVSNIKGKLGVTTRLEAALLARELTGESDRSVMEHTPSR